MKVSQKQRQSGDMGIVTDSWFSAVNAFIAEAGLWLGTADGSAIIDYGTTYCLSFC